MIELTDFPPEEQELIKEMLSLDYTKEGYEKRKWELLSSLSIEGLEYVREHVFDIVVNKVETDANKAIAKLEKYDQEQKKKQELAIQRCKKEARTRCDCIIAGIFVVATLAIVCIIHW